MLKTDGFDQIEKWALRFFWAIFRFIGLFTAIGQVLGRLFPNINDVFCLVWTTLQVKGLLNSSVKFEAATLSGFQMVLVGFTPVEYDSFINTVSYLHGEA